MSQLRDTRASDFQGGSADEFQIDELKFLRRKLLVVNGMQQHFPVIRDREAVLNEIQSRDDLREIFESWKEQYRESRRKIRC